MIRIALSQEDSAMEAVRFGSWAKPLLMTWCGDRGPRLVELIRIRLGDGNPRFSRYASGWRR